MYQFTTSKSEQKARSRRGHANRKSHEPPIVPSPATTEREYDADETELLAAMQAYQARTHQRFPTYCEILAVMKSLGYRKVPA